MLEKVNVLEFNYYLPASTSVNLPTVSLQMMRLYRPSSEHLLCCRGKVHEFPQCGATVSVLKESFHHIAAKVGIRVLCLDLVLKSKAPFQYFA